MIDTNAFHGLAGPFPEIEIVNVHTVFIQPRAFYSEFAVDIFWLLFIFTILELFAILVYLLRFSAADEFKLNISNCAHLTLSTEAFANTTFHGLFEKIQEFDLLKGAFSRATARIVIQDSHLKKIDELHATLREIRFIGCSIDTIETNAFDVLKIDSIIFENCQIGLIQANAFTEKVRPKTLARFLSQDYRQTIAGPD